MNEEREEERVRAKRAKEQLREFLETHSKMHSHMRWRKACEMFEGETIWEDVPERDRKDIFDDVIFYLSKKEKEDERKLHIRNREYMLEVFSLCTSISYRTLWSEVSFLSCETLCKMEPDASCIGIIFL